MRLESAFIPQFRKATPVISSTKINLQLAQLGISNSGKFSLKWKDDVRNAELADTSFASGATKLVYKVHRYVIFSLEFNVILRAALF